jgi:hypothetical protein
MFHCCVFSKSDVGKNEKDRIKKNDCLAKDKKDKLQVFILTIDERLKLVEIQSKIDLFLSVSKLFKRSYLRNPELLKFRNKFNLS